MRPSCSSRSRPWAEALRNPWQTAKRFENYRPVLPVGCRRHAPRVYPSPGSPSRPARGPNYLFPLALSGEIFPLTTVQVVPYAKPWFGVVNLRGGLYGVVDMASFVGEGLARHRSEQALSESSLVTFNAALEVNCALMVDSLSGLRNRESFSSVEPAPEGSPVYFGNRYRDLGAPSGRKSICGLCPSSLHF